MKRAHPSALAGLALMGLPSSGAYSAKKLLLDAAEPVKTRAPVSRLAETAALALANPARRAAIAVGRDVRADRRGAAAMAWRGSR